MNIGEGSGRAKYTATRYGASRPRINRARAGFAGAAMALALAGRGWAAPVKALAFGDSLFAGYGVAASDSFPAQLQRALQANGREVEVINASVSGDTTADGLARLDWSLADKPDLVLLELGANDALRGLDPAIARSNLDQILARLAAAHIPTLICGMLAPRNLGAAYDAKFDAIYPDLAAKYHVPLYPFVLDGVALDARLNQADGMHPNPAGVAVIVKRILPAVEKALSSPSPPRG